MLFLLGSGRRSINGRAADSSIQAIQWFRSGPRDRCGGDRVAKGEKKTAGFAGGFFGNFGCASRAINPLDPPAV
ncbi:hypothetical protein LGM43_20205 [Burkholderia seminalis]|uniref:hypothetical protein n=1 Tax=Burkholderia seminalis TaxID=488731 RepID=UPI001CF23380|nr:hypothetical protein [Burkholderia seminalis]MCA7952592.1 hypothetical protein [Burkholderia seminalis]